MAVIKWIEYYLSDAIVIGRYLGAGIATLGQPLFWMRDLLDYLDSFSDPKLRDYPLMGSPLGVLSILLVYLMIVIYGLDYVHEPPRSHYYQHQHPSRRKSMVWLRKPAFNVALFAYNAGMALLNAQIAYDLIYGGIKADYNFLCQLVYTGTDNPYETRIARAIYFYFASKGFELLDTCLIIARRKSAQLTFLHIYHHSTMFIVWWVGAKFVPGGSALSGALVNCLVHVLMYAYYALATLGPKVRPYLWWKKYLTIIQLVQFMAGVSLGLNSIFSGCAFTRWMQYVFVAYAFSFLVLFGKFYIATYSRSRRRKAKQTPSTSKDEEPQQQQPTPPEVKGAKADEDDSSGTNSQRNRQSKRKQKSRRRKTKSSSST